MPVVPQIIHVEAPYKIRNLQTRLQQRLHEMKEEFRSIGTTDPAVARLQGHLNGLAEALLILADLEEKDGRKG